MDRSISSRRSLLLKSRASRLYTLTFEFIREVKFLKRDIKTAILKYSIPTPWRIKNIYFDSILLRQSLFQIGSLAYFYWPTRKAQNPRVPTFVLTTFFTSLMIFSVHLLLQLIAKAHFSFPQVPYSSANHLSDMSLETSYVPASTLPSPPPSRPVCGLMFGVIKRRATITTKFSKHVYFLSVDRRSNSKPNNSRVRGTS